MSDGRRGNEFRARLLSGAALGALTVVAVLVGGPLYDIVVAGAAAVAVGEVYRLFGRLVPAAPPYERAGQAATAALVLVLGVAPDGRWIATIGLLALLGSLSSLPLLPQAARWDRWGMTACGLLYIAPLAAALIRVRVGGGGGDEVGRSWTLLVAAVTWGCDTAAYAVGRSVGKRPFFPAISPKKTLEGTIGGIVGGTLIGVLVGVSLGVPRPTVVIGLMAVSGSVAAVVGDLIESLLKRQADVKDSGTLIPGHGGLLDRIDGLLFVGALVYCWSLWG